MSINGLLIIWIIPSIIYYFINKKKGNEKRLILNNLGINWGNLKYALLGLLLGTIGVVLTVYFINKNIFPDFVNNYNLNNSTVDLPKNFKTFLQIFIIVGLSTAIGEEVFFRGFLGGLFMRKWNFIKGNILQSIIFSFFHIIPIAFINPKLILFSFLYSFTSGFVLGILYYKSKSVFPSILAHSIGFPILFIIT